jgi:hypothetical protein
MNLSLLKKIILNFAAAGAFSGSSQVSLVPVANTIRPAMASGPVCRPRYTHLLLVLLCLSLLGGARLAEASHFKGGQVTYEDQGGGTYKVTFKSYWRSTAYGFIAPTYSGSYTALTDLVVESIDQLPDGLTVEILQRQTIKWNEPGLYTISWTSCCRVGEGSNFGQSNFGLFAAVNYDPARPSSSPQFYDLPLFNFKAGAPLSYSLNVIDPDGHLITYSLATPVGEAATLYDQMIATGFSISSGGVISWTDPQEGIWLVNVKLAERINGQYTGAYVLREYLLNINGQVDNSPPVFVPIPAKSIPEENLLQFTVQATDAEGHSVKLQATGLPLLLGASFTQTGFGATATGTFSWTPPAGSSGTYTIVFVATDNANFPLSSQLNVEITVTVGGAGACESRQLTLTSIDNVCVAAAAFDLENPFGAGTFTGPGVTGGLFSPALAGVGTHTVTCTFTEGGCTHISTQEITVTPLLEADAGPDQGLVVEAGKEVKATLEAKAQGKAPFTFKWSHGASGQTVQVALKETTTFTLEVTDASGCTAFDEVTVFVDEMETVTNGSCGKKGNKVLVCHNGHQICISANAVPAHLAHGCYVGVCDERSSKPGNGGPKGKPISSFTVSPNPVSQQQQAKLEFLPLESAAFTVEVFNMQGLSVSKPITGTAQAGQLVSVYLPVSGLKKGMYLVKLTAGQQVEYKRILLEK